jgi:hypothetical protein
VNYLREALAKLETFAEPEGFFESGFFLDVHGYKVSMRDQLLNADFLYLSAAINARLHNLLEGWISDREQLHDANRLTSKGSPREQIMSLLAEQEDAVDNIFGINRKRPPRAAPKRARAAGDEDAQQQKKKKKKRQKQRRDISVSLDRQFAVVVVLALLIVGSAGFLLRETGAVGAPSIEPVPLEEVRKKSELIIRALVHDPGTRDAYVKLWLHNGKWRALSPREKKAEADTLAEIVRSLGVQNGKAGPRPDQPVVEIRDGLVVKVVGAD